ncbi:MAG: hypothetical protein WDZ28_01980 [Simkaniaceae bacterium]
MNKKKFKKTPFVLLEALIALSLLALGGGYLIHQPLHLFKQELKLLIEIELERVSENTLYEILDSLRENHPFDELKERNKKNVEFISLNELALSIPKLESYTVKRRYKVWVKRIFETENEESAKLIALEIEQRIDNLKARTLSKHQIFLKKSKNIDKSF